MKRHLCLLVLAALCLSFVPVLAQPGSQPLSGPTFNGAMDKLFGDNQAFTATLELQITDETGKIIAMPGQISFDAGKSRFESNMSAMQGIKVSPQGAVQMKALGLDQTIEITRPDKKTGYLIYPGMQSYVEHALSDADTAAAPGDYKMSVTELGHETVNGHPCVKNKVVVTDPKGNNHESTVWNATDLKQFPVKIEVKEAGRTTTMLFKDISLAKPDASLFEVPAGYTAYDNAQTMMRQQIMKRMGHGTGSFPPIAH
jgi:Domain of unknown function (DUF4412)